MSMYGLVIAAGISALVVAPSLADHKTDSAKLIGRWVVTKAEKDEPVGALVEFGTNGRLTVNTKDRKTGKDVVYNGIYKIDGEKLLITLRVESRDQVKPPVTIRSLSASHLVIVKQSEVLEFKRAN